MAFKAITTVSDVFPALDTISKKEAPLKKKLVHVLYWASLKTNFITFHQNFWLKVVNLFGSILLFLSHNN